MKIISVFLLFFASINALGKCQENLHWKLTKSGSIEKLSVTDFIFLNPEEILVAGFPEKGKTTAPLLIYRKQNGAWVKDISKSNLLPSTMHPRQLTYKKLKTNDEIMAIADHGTDEAPFPGAYPVILRKEKNYWIHDKKSSTLGKDFTFNVALAETSDKRLFLLKGNVHGKTPPMFELQGNTWTDVTDILPSEMKPGGLCMMNTLAGDFNNDGTEEIFLGGCDLDKANPLQAQDRLMFYSQGKWALANTSTFPSRMENSMWGTVSAKVIDYNGDNKKDILVATHDFGFHRWRVLVYINESTKKEFKFSQKLLPLIQENKTEGFIYAVEDFDLPSDKIGFLAEVRSVIRNKQNTPPKLNNRLLIKDQNQISDASECLPELLQKKLFHAKTIPEESNKLLLIAFDGEIYTLEVSPGLNR